MHRRMKVSKKNWNEPWHCWLFQLKRGRHQQVQLSHDQLHLGPFEIWLIQVWEFKWHEMSTLPYWNISDARLTARYINCFGHDNGQRIAFERKTCLFLPISRSTWKRPQAKARDIMAMVIHKWPRLEVKHSQHLENQVDDWITLHDGEVFPHSEADDNDSVMSRLEMLIVWSFGYAVNSCNEM